MSGKGKDEGGFLQRLRGELAAWVGEGIITAEQGERIRGRYDFSAAEREEHRERNRAVAVVTMAGAALVGLGVILFFAANWSEIPRWGRFALILAGMGGLHYSGYRLGWEPGRYPATGRALVTAGCLLFGAGIWQVSQAFNISSHYPNGVLLWAAGTLPVAAVLASSPVLSLYALLLGAWTALETAGFERANPAFFPLILLTLFPLAYRFRLRFPFALGLLALTLGLALDAPHWGREHAWDGFGNLLFLLPAWGAFLVAAGGLQLTFPGWGAFARAYRVPGYLLLGAMLLPFTFGEVVRDAGREAHGGAPLLAVMAALLLLSAAAALLAIRRREGAELVEARWEGWVAFLSGAFLLAILLKPLAFPGWVLAVGANLLHLALAGVLVLLADRTREWWMGYLGVVLFTALVICRYFEYAWELLPKSLVFLLAGGMLLAGGLALEKRRRAVKTAVEEVAP